MNIEAFVLNNEEFIPDYTGKYIDLTGVPYIETYIDPASADPSKSGGHRTSLTYGKYKINSQIAVNGTIYLGIMQGTKSYDSEFANTFIPLDEARQLIGDS